MSRTTNARSYNLAVETSGPIGSVALGRSYHIWEVCQFSMDHAHAVELLPTLQNLCRHHDVEPVQVAWCFISAGPGSFTGVRIGMTVGRILRGCGVRVVRIPTLEVIAQNALELPDPPATIAVLVDAKREHVFSAVFVRSNGCYLPINPPEEVSPAEVLDSLPSGAGVIAGARTGVMSLVESRGLRLLPESLARARAESVYRLGLLRAIDNRFDAVNDLVPIYIRRPEAEEVWEARRSIVGARKPAAGGSAES